MEKLRCICGTEFTPKRSGQKHCSAKCRGAAYEKTTWAAMRRAKYRSKRRNRNIVPDGNENGVPTRKRGRPKEPGSLRSLRQELKQRHNIDIPLTDLWRQDLINELPKEMADLTGETKRGCCGQLVRKLSMNRAVKLGKLARDDPEQFTQLIKRLLGYDDSNE